MSERELEECPHCESGDCYVERADLSSSVVICNSCLSRGPECCPENDKDLKTEEDEGMRSGEMAARRAWNTRTLPAPVIAALDALEEIVNYADDVPDCPMCDYGKLRNPNKGHWPDCGYYRAHKALTACKEYRGGKR